MTKNGVSYALDIAYDDTVALPGADDQLSFEVGGTISSGDQSYPVVYRFVVALVGPLVSLVGAYTVGSDSSRVVDTTEELARVQVERVARLG